MTHRATWSATSSTLCALVSKVGSIRARRDAAKRWCSAMRCLEPLGEHVVRAIQVAEVNVANERPRRERFELLRLQ